jgi:hypothetical protein
VTGSSTGIITSPPNANAYTHHATPAESFPQQRVPISLGAMKEGDIPMT